MRTFAVDSGFGPDVRDPLDDVESFAAHESKTTPGHHVRIGGELFRPVLEVGSGAVVAEIWSSPDSVIVELAGAHVRCATMLDALACVRWFAPLLQLEAP